MKEVTKFCKDCRHGLPPDRAAPHWSCGLATLSHHPVTGQPGPVLMPCELARAQECGFDGKLYEARNNG